MAIDTALDQKPADFDALLKLLREARYEIKPGKTLALRGKNQKRFIRLDTLGSGYSEAELRAVLSAKKHTHRAKKSSGPHVGKTSQSAGGYSAKLRAGKGIGYERWAKVFNLTDGAKH